VEFIRIHIQSSMLMMLMITSMLMMTKTTTTMICQRNASHFYQEALTRYGLVTATVMVNLTTPYIADGMGVTVVKRHVRTGKLRVAPAGTTALIR